MKKIFATGVATLALAAFSLNALSEEAAAPEETGPFASGNFSSTIWLTNNYMFRGISNSDGPAIQGSVDWGYSGFFVGAWASNTELSDDNFEIDYYGGYRWSWSGLDFVLQGIYYTYPGESENFSDGLDPGFGVETDYGEVNVGVSHVFEGQLAPSIGANYWFSPDAFGEDGNNHTVQGTFGLTLPAEIGFYANVGYSDFEGDQSSGAIGGYDYAYFSVGINKSFKGFKFDIGYHGTDESSDLEAFYADAPIPGGENFRDLIEGEVVFTVSRTF
jgi:uncharacterized protein (TIGR02001 family)